MPVIDADGHILEQEEMEAMRKKPTKLKKNRYFRLGQLVTFISLLFTLILFQSAWSQSGSSRSKTITVGLSTLGGEDIRPWMIAAPVLTPLANIYEFLLHRNPKTRALEPGLAERWKASPDGRSITFFLRRGVQFHKSMGEMTAHDVAFSFDQFMQPKARSSISRELRRVVDSHKAVDDYTFQLRLKKKRTADFLGNFSDVPPRLTILSRKYFEKVGEKQAVSHPVGTGPFRFVRRLAGEEMRLEALPEHWRKTAPFGTLVLKQVPEPSTRIAMLRTGAADIIELPIEFKEDIRKAGQEVIVNPDIALVYVQFGGQVLPGHKNYRPDHPWVGPSERAKKVRQALTMAIDHQEILDTILNGVGTRGAVPFFFPGEPWTDPGWKPSSYDPEKAKRLLAQAGYPNGFEVELRLVPLAGRPELPEIGKAVALYWEQIGMKVKQVPMDWGRMVPDIRKRNMVGVVWVYAGVRYDEPVFGLKIFGLSRSPWSFIAEDKTFDKLIDKALTELDDQKRLAIQRKLGKYMYDQHFTATIGTMSAVFGVSRVIKRWPLVQGYPYPLNYEYLELGSTK